MTTPLQIAMTSHLTKELIYDDYLSKYEMRELVDEFEGKFDDDMVLAEVLATVDNFIANVRYECNR